jgi:hypothetical protein
MPQCPRRQTGTADSHSSFRPSNRFERRQVFEAREFTRVFAEGHFADQAAEDFTATSLGQLGDESDPVRGKRLAERMRDPFAQLGSEGLRRHMSVVQDGEAVDDFAFKVIGYSDRGRLGDRTMCGQD